MKRLLNNKILQFSLVLIAGLFLGWLLFNNSSSTQHDHSQIKKDETTFTCSMHPQIRQNEPGKCPICGMDLIPVSRTADKGEVNLFVHTMSPEAIALANIQTQKVKSVSPEREIRLTGKVALNERTLSAISANFAGRIERLYIDFTGQSVNSGQKLATIYSPELTTAQKELIESSKFKETNPALYNAAKNKLQLWKITDSQIKSIEESGTVQANFDVYAHQSGVVLVRNISLGDYVNRGDVLFEIADLKNVWVLFDAYESDLPFVKTGHKLSFTASSLPNKEFASKISFIDPFINPQTRTASVRAEVNNSEGLLKPDMFVNGIVSASISSSKTVTIPKTALLWTGKRSIVYVKVPDSEHPAFEMREISIGTSLGDYYIVEEGLTVGEEIVTNGVFAIDAAAQLSGNYSMMNRPTSKYILTPEIFTEQLTDFINQYFLLKNFLVESNYVKSNESAKKLLTVFRKIDMTTLNENAHTAWMEHSSPLKNSLDKLTTASDINVQREQFSTLTNHLTETLEYFKLKVDVVYVTYCPMAFDDKGAYWLSEFEAIKNPYFGDAMLTCGEIVNRFSSFKNLQTDKPQAKPLDHQH
jgi:membrane fusion protein, copper/silver efflux system